MDILSKTTNGIIFKCDSCKSIHIEYKNINFNFTKEQLNYFIDSIFDINATKVYEQNKHILYKRKIVIPIGNQNVNVLLNKEELIELKELLWSVRNKNKLSKTIAIGSLEFQTFFN